MTYRIKEFAQLFGVSVRTLHHYDNIGLLHPSYCDDSNGYRYYDSTSAERMQEIMFYRELDFPLKDIISILDSPDYNRSEALKKQKSLLILKHERIKRLIAALDDAMKGEDIMSNRLFDNTEYKQLRAEYAAEAKQRWGDTAAYKEYEQKADNADNPQMNALIAEFSDLCLNNESPEGERAQALTVKWQKMITENYYTCTKEILAGLGQMYTADPRFTQTLDRRVNGTAEFMSSAIRVYCGQL